MKLISRSAMVGKWGRRVLLFAILMLAAAVPAGAAETSDRPEQQLGRLFVASGMADGLAMAVIQNDRVQYFNFGTISPTSVQPPTPDTAFEIGSITKVFTSLLLAQAVVEGRVGLHDDIRQHLPGDYPNLAWDGAPVQLVHLAETTSGLPDNIPDLAPYLAQGGAARAPFLIAERWQDYTEADLLAALASARLVSKPGAESRHSNVAASLLGIILERVYAEPYPSLVKRHIEQPFGMATGTGNRRPLAIGRDANGNTMPLIVGRHILAAGGLRYSSADLGRFVRAQIRAQSPAIRLSQQATGGGQPATLGFNWQFASDRVHGRILRTSGGTFGSSSYVEIRPDRGCGLVLLANRSGAEGALYTLASEIWEKGLCGQRPVAPISNSPAAPNKR